MDFVFTEDIARANLLAATSEATDEVFNIGSGTETSLAELAQTLLACHGERSAARVRPAADSQRGDAGASPMSRSPGNGSAGRPRSGWRKASAGWCHGGAPSVQREAPRRDSGHAAVAWRRGGRRGGQRGGLGLGRAGPACRRVRTRLRRGDRRGSRGRGLLVHRGPAPRDGRVRDRARRRGDRALAVLHSHRQRGALRRCAPGLRGCRSPDAEPDSRHRAAPSSPSALAPSSSSTRRACRPTSTACATSVSQRASR